MLLQKNLGRDEAKEADTKGIKVSLRSLNLIQQVIGNFWRNLISILTCKDSEFKIIAPVLWEEWIEGKQLRGAGRLLGVRGLETSTMGLPNAIAVKMETVKYKHLKTEACFYSFLYSQ